MIYLRGDGVSVVVLESANLDELKKGRPAHSPDKSVLIAWTPAPAWLALRLKELFEHGAPSAEEVGRLIDESTRRPEEPPRPHFQTEHYEAEGNDHGENR